MSCKRCFPGVSCGSRSGSATEDSCASASSICSPAESLGEVSSKNKRKSSALISPEAEEVSSGGISRPEMHAPPMKKVRVPPKFEAAQRRVRVYRPPPLPSELEE